MSNDYISCGTTWNAGDYYDVGHMKETCPSLDDYDGSNEDEVYYEPSEYLYDN